MQKIIRLSIVRFLIGIIIVGVPYFAILLIGQNLLDTTSLSLSQVRSYKTMFFLVLGFLVVVLYRIYFKFIEQKPVFEFSRNGVFSESIKGIVYTTIVSGIVLLILFLNKNIEITKGSGLVYLPVAFSIAFMSSIAEEVLFRGLLFRLSEEKLGTYISIIISSLLFGIAHYVNPGSTVLSAIAIGLESGLILSATYILTRKLWLNIAIHFTWNFIAEIMGFHFLNNKGDGGIFDSKLSGSKLLTGGELGVEFSLLIVITGIVSGLYLISIAYKKGLIIKPFWKQSDERLTIT